MNAHLFKPVLVERLLWKVEKDVITVVVSTQIFIYDHMTLMNYQRLQLYIEC